MAASGAASSSSSTTASPAGRRSATSTSGPRSRRASTSRPGYFEIGALLALDGKWQKLDKIRILMGAEVTHRHEGRVPRGDRGASRGGARRRASRPRSETDPFLDGVPAIVEALKRGQIECRVYTQGQVPRQGVHHAREARRRRLAGARRLVATSRGRA